MSNYTSKRANYWCVVCEDDKENSNTLFSFPRTPTRKAKWMEILKLSDSSIRRRSKVCQKHFKSDQMKNIRLIKGAMPSLTQCKPHIPGQINHL